MNIVIRFLSLSIRCRFIWGFILTRSFISVFSVVTLVLLRLILTCICVSISARSSFAIIVFLFVWVKVILRCISSGCIRRLSSIVVFVRRSISTLRILLSIFGTRTIRRIRRLRRFWTSFVWWRGRVSGSFFTIVIFVSVSLRMSWIAIVICWFTVISGFLFASFVVTGLLSIRYWSCTLGSIFSYTFALYVLRSSLVLLGCVFILKRRTRLFRRFWFLLVLLIRVFVFWSLVGIFSKKFWGVSCRWRKRSLCFRGWMYLRTWFVLGTFNLRRYERSRSILWKCLFVLCI